MLKIYTTSECGYCKTAKELLTRRKIPFSEINLSVGDKAQWDDLIRLSGAKTVPQIFAGTQRVGGYKELVALDRRDGLASLSTAQ